MTEEQIKQNAEEYASTKEMHSPRSQDVELDKLMIIEDYIAGAHSRDEEIEQLQKENLYMESLLSMHRKMTGEYELKLQKLHKPWISVKERLPQKINKFISEPVLCRYTRGMKECFNVSQYDFEFDEWQISNVTHWMPIPELKK